MPVPVFSPRALPALLACLFGVLAAAWPVAALAAQDMGTSMPAFSLAAALGVEAALVTGTFLGVIGASFIYLLSTWAVIRDRGQVYLVLMLLCMIVHLMAAGGYFGAAGNSTLVTEFFLKGTLLLFYFFTTVFTIQYLEFDVDFSPFRFILFALAALLAVMLLGAAIDLAFVSGLLPWLGLVTLLLLMTACVLSFGHHIGSACPLLLAFCVILIGQLHTLPLDWASLNVPVLGGDITPISFSVCAMLFAVVTAAQFASRQEKKEFELARSNQRFQMAAAGSNEGLYDIGLTRAEGYFSERLMRIFGLNLRNASGLDILRRWLGIIHAGDRASVRRALFAFLRNPMRTTLTLEYRIVRERKILWLTATAVVVRDAASGRALRVVGAVGDITEKKRAEMRMKMSEQRFRSIAEAHPVPVVIATVQEGEIVYATDSTEKLLRAPMGQLLGQSFDAFFAEAGARSNLMQELRKSGRIELREVMLKRKDRTSFPAALTARLIDYERRPCTVLGIYDLSERKAAEMRIKEAEGALQQSEKLAALGGLLAGVAHELNNPLSVIVGQAVLMGETAKDDKTTQRAEKIQKAGERCSRIVRSFLSLARRKPSEKKPIEINEVIENSLELLAFQLRTDNVELVRKLSPSLPLVMADADQMTQVITNLVINAKQALADKKNATRTISVETRHMSGVRNFTEGSVQVTVSDNGPGVPREIAKRIFEPFFTTKAAGAGTGVGLSLCHNIVETHGGRIWVKDAAGGGACFIFTLPANAVAVSQENLAHATAHRAKPSAQRILIVDDEIELGQTLADILEPDGHSMVLVHNGQQALAALRDSAFDLIISDLRMPVLDGPGFYRALEKAKSPYLPRIIFVTGDTLSVPVREFLIQYALDVIEKPYTPEEVRRAVAERVRALAAGKGTGDSDAPLPAASAMTPAATPAPPPAPPSAMPPSG